MNPDSQSNAQSGAGTNPLLAHLNDVDESHATTRVDFAHPGEIVQPQPLAAAPKTPKAPAAPAAPVVEAPPMPPAAPPKPSAPRSPHNGRPILIALGIIVLLAALGAGGWWYFKYYRKNSSSSTNNNAQQSVQVVPQAPSGLAEADTGGKALVAGGASGKGQVTLSFAMTTSANSGSVTPDIEVEPLATAFTNQPTQSGSATPASGGTINASLTVTGLKEGAYHWQARFSGGGTSSDWTAFAASGVTTADFAIDLTPPAAAKITTVGSASIKASASSATTINNQPTIAGTADPGSAIAINIQPDNIALSATADSDGKWSVTPTSAIPNGDHTLSIVAADAAGNTTTASFTLSINTVAAAPATAQIAPTGDDTRPLTLVGLALMVGAAAGLILRRRGSAKA